MQTPLLRRRAIFVHRHSCCDWKISLEFFARLPIICPMMKSILFLQLPIQRLTLADQDQNFPAAAYALSAYVQQRPIGRDFKFQILDPTLQNAASDETLLSAILRQTPDMLAFSFYCWNIERSLALAEQVKQAFSNTTAPVIIAGGPEVTPDNPLLHHPMIDLYVAGEGEVTFEAVLREWCVNGQVPRNLPGTMYVVEDTLFVNPPQPQAVDLNATRPPHLTGMVPRRPWNDLFCETMRGCPFHCHFCYYHKTARELRLLRRDTILDLVRHAVEQQYDSLFFLDPCFNLHPDLNALLNEIAAINVNRQVKLATELRADLLTPQQARLLAEAGFYDVEIGLQSIHPETIKNTGRTQDLKKFLRGAEAMLAQGIHCKVDLMVGLPGDNLTKFKQSARWVKRHGLDGDLQVFCLSVLPGTYFRQHADTLKLRYAPFQPYYLRSSPDWSLEDIHAAFTWAEDYFGITFEPETARILPLEIAADQRRNGLHEVIEVQPDAPFMCPDQTAYTTTWIIGPLHTTDDLWQHLPAMQAYTGRNPYGAYHVVLDLQRPLPLNALLEFCTAFKPVKTLFLDRDLSVFSGAALHHYQVTLRIPRTEDARFSARYLKQVSRHFQIVHYHEATKASRHEEEREL